MFKNQKWLKCLNRTLEDIRTLESMPDLDICHLKKLKKDVNALAKRLSDIVEDIHVLSLPENDTKSLNEAASMEDDLGNMMLNL